MSAPSAPYYEDDLVTLYHGDSLDVMTELEAESVNVLLADPPYFNVKDDDWDRQWSQCDDFLAWLGTALDVATPALKASASVWVFASPALASTIELQVIVPRFRLLNSIRWVKEHGWHQKTDTAAQRRYLTPWEGVLFAERFGAEAFASAPIGAYLQGERERAGVSRPDLARHFPSRTGGITGCVTNWEMGLNMPSSEQYAVMRHALGEGHLCREYEALRKEYEALRKEYEALRRPFDIVRQRGPVADVWNFATVPPYAGKHPCEKPLSMLTHMIEATSRPGDLILDPFAGSGSTLRAAKDLGRRAIGIEQDERYCDWIANRLAQDTLFGGAA